MAINYDRPAAPVAATRCRLLLVDDDADTRHVLARLLSREFQVNTAACYDSAVFAAEHATPDLVIADLGLPGRDGVELMRTLHARHGVNGIAVTGHTIDDPAALRAAGFIKYFCKPIGLDELLRAVHESCAVGAS